MTDLQKTRAAVDEIDREIAELFEKRMRLTEDIAEYKLEHGMRVVDPEREEEMYRELRSMASTEFNAIGIQEVLKQIISISRKRQYQIQTENGMAEDLGFEEIDEVYKNKKVVFQGVEGAYGYAAMLAYFGEGVDCFHVPTFKKAIEAIVDKEANFAVLPIENSTAGIVTDMYDLLMNYDITIVDEYVLKVEHKLLGLPGTKLSDIKGVYSHPQALAVVCGVFCYTNHTVMPEALETWNEDLFRLKLPRIYAIIKEINERFCREAWKYYPGNWEKISQMSIIAYGQVRMANLAVVASHHINGVSKLHSEILRETVFKDFYRVHPERFLNVTNGIAHRRWLCYANPELSALLDGCIGTGYRKNPEQLAFST